MKVETPELFLDQLPEERKSAIAQLRKSILEKIPNGFTETLSYGMLAFVVPHALYPEGYHCNPKEPLPFISIASQKNCIALYHMGLYTDDELLEWFKEEYPKHSKIKLNMGKSCIRFKKPDHIPFELIGELFTKMSAKEWIEVYENKLKK